MNLLQTVTLVFLPSIYIALACCALAQWSLAFNALSSAAHHVARTPALEAFGPVLQAFVRFLEQIFGCAAGAARQPQGGGAGLGSAWRGLLQRLRLADAGPAYKFVPNPTHVLLVALMLVIIAHR